MKFHTDQLIALRAQIEEGTAIALTCARRNEFIGDPVTKFEREVRTRRDRAMRRQLKKARAAFERFEKICQEVGV